VLEEQIEQQIRRIFDAKPSGIIRTLDLKRPIYKSTSAYGHFGRSESSFTWERTDQAEAFRRLFKN